MGHARHRPHDRPDPDHARAGARRPRRRTPALRRFRHPGSEVGPHPWQTLVRAARSVRRAAHASRRGRLPRGGPQRHAQLRCAPGPPGTARAAGAAIRARAGAHAHRRQLQPGLDARHHRLRAAVRRLRQPASLVEERARGVSLPGARLRPPLRDLPGLRHRDDPGADDRRRSRSRSGRAAGQGRRSDPGHVVHAEVQQPDRHGVLERDRGTAGGHAHGGAGLPAVLGQRLRRAPSHAPSGSRSPTSSRPARGTGTRTARSSTARRPRSRSPAPASRCSDRRRRTSRGT